MPVTSSYTIPVLSIANRQVPIILFISLSLPLKYQKHISEISSTIGYDNQNYFSQQFKKIVGISPMHYRQHKKK
ncbi:MAG TPA: AraC family transcriptional regulator [Clostridiales bacterium]|nr:AraC family transcriptional regulator [Clostridiales bacterium]